MRFLIGVDGGGTGTRLRLSTVDGRQLGQGDAGPSALGQGVAQAWAHVQQALQVACRGAGMEQLDLAECAIGLGMSGAGNAQAVAEFLSGHPGYARVVLDNDGYTTVLGAHGGEPGAVIASGTGSVGEALRRDGSRVCVGGWGWIIGDEGSGAWLGQKAMRHAMQALDGRAQAGTLARGIWRVAGQDRESLIAWCAAAGQHGYATLAPLVFEHAAGDAVAEGFVGEAVIELEKLAAALDPAGDLPMALCGSIAVRLGPLFSTTLRQRCVPPQGDSAAGALLLIRRALS
ncbi:BadF/BadG/BcrA/BcrD ATPase family protein [Pelomonas sp. SE-A7]|uniref:BadF/BadG/BcrA/BcrD ATPase family protein n=1 Tax=Pelomonas sp. SE-A7 TaxID=3054953 RepID=UPI00259D0373|nr:BadF/BadG/BcrA/BcrD ATPase family protein [Pelomonas sp. SE-A7]MDM4766831.1 BadF/BadG/BcrA/BcrD ATPase family protein [Pelomonas sp. SE-A7]